MTTPGPQGEVACPDSRSYCGQSRNSPWSPNSLAWVLSPAHSQLSKQGQGMICIWLGPTCAYVTRILQSRLPFGRENSIYVNTRDPDTNILVKLLPFPYGHESAGVEARWERTGNRVNGFRMETGPLPSLPLNLRLGVLPRNISGMETSPKKKSLTVADGRVRRKK